MIARADKAAALLLVATGCGSTSDPGDGVGGRIDPLDTIATIEAAAPDAFAPLEPGQHLRQEISWEWEAAEDATLQVGAGLWRTDGALSLSWVLVEESGSDSRIIGGSPFSETMYPLGSRPVCACRVGEPEEGMLAVLLDGGGAEPGSAVLIALPRPTPRPIPDELQEHGVQYVVEQRAPLRVVRRFELPDDHTLEGVRILEAHPSGDVLRVRALERSDAVRCWELDFREERIREAPRGGGADPDRGSR